MDEEYLMHSIDRRNKPQRREHYANSVIETDASETDVSVSDAGVQRERQTRSRARLDSYEQAHVSREMLQQMQDSYRMRSHTDLFLDEKTLMKKKRVICAISGIIVILLIMLIILIAAVAGVGFLIWRGELQFLPLSLNGGIDANTVQSLQYDIETLFNDIQHIENNTSTHIDLFSNMLDIIIETFSDNPGKIEALIDQVNRLTAATRNNFTLVNSQLATAKNETSNVNNRTTNLENQFRTTQSSVDSRMTSLENQLETTQSDISSLQSVANDLQTSITSIDNKVSTPVSLYHNCRQDTTVCNVTTLRDTRLYCSTSALIIDIQVSKLN